MLFISEEPKVFLAIMALSVFVNTGSDGPFTCFNPGNTFFSALELALRLA